MARLCKRISSPINYISYAAGFAAGNYIGILLESKLAVGLTMLRIITRTRAKELIVSLREMGYRVTHVPAEANSGKVQVIFLPTRRKEIPKLINIVQAYNPNALYTIEDMRSVSMWSIPGTQLNTNRRDRTYWRLYRFKRKGK